MTFEVISCTINNFIICVQRSDVACKQLILLSYSTGRLLYNAERDLLAIAKFLLLCQCPFIITFYVFGFGQVLLFIFYTRRHDSAFLSNLRQNMSSCLIWSVGESEKKSNNHTK